MYSAAYYQSAVNRLRSGIRRDTRRMETCVAVLGQLTAMTDNLEINQSVSMASMQLDSAVRPRIRALSDARRAEEQLPNVDPVLYEAISHLRCEINQLRSAVADQNSALGSARANLREARERERREED